MSDLYPSRARLDLLRAIEYRRVALGHSGTIIRRSDGAYNQRVNGKVRELEQAGWVRLGHGGMYELTDEGRAVREAARR